MRFSLCGALANFVELFGLAEELQCDMKRLGADPADVRALSERI